MENFIQVGVMAFKDDAGKYQNPIALYARSEAADNPKLKECKETLNDLAELSSFLSSSS